MKKIIVGTRGSLLALKQTEIVINKLKSVFKYLDFEIKKITTSGDKNQNISLTETSVKNLFVKEIEEELMSKKIDIAVHSMKDIPNNLPEGLIIGCIPDREDNRDVLISKHGEKLDKLKKSAVIGTSSLRRKIQIEKLRPDLKIIELRGNIHTRINKLENGEYDGIILAAAGLKRVGLENKITQYFTIEEMMPSPCQGAICLEIRENDEEIINIVSKINEDYIDKIILAEKEFSKIFNGGCKIPIGASGKILEGKLELSGLYFDGNKLIKEKNIDDIENYIKCAKKLSEIIRSKING